MRGLWNGFEKAWYISFTQENVQKLHELGVVFSLQLLEAVKVAFPREFSAALLQRVRQSVAHSMALPLPPIEGLYRELLPYQRSGIAAIKANGGRALLADEMGLGKTLQAIGFVHLNQFEKVIVICPLSAMFNWKAEITEALGEQSVCMIRGTKGGMLPDARWYLINYEDLSLHVAQLQALNAPCVIIDESHYVKNQAAKRTKACVEVAQHSPYVLALTGTPILNRVVEFWTVLIRRTKAEVLPQLPPKRRSAVLLDIDNRADYEATEHELMKLLEESNLSIAEREEAKVKFNNDPGTRVIVFGLEVGSEGHTLTSASHVAFMELPWQPGKTNQAEDRVRRIGQTADSVQIYHLVAVQTIEEAMGNLLRKKQIVMNLVLPETK